MTTNVSKSADGGVRSFLAVDLHPNIRARCAHVLAQLEPHREALKLVSPAALHVTVKFLGGVAPTRLEEVTAVAGDTAATCQAFTLQLSGVGTFPGGGRVPRVIWVGLARDGGFEAFQLLYQSIEAALQTLGFAPETRPFSPHLTLARARDGLTREQGARLAEAVARLGQQDFGPLSFPVRELTLFRSDLSAAGPRYTSLARFPLLASDPSPFPRRA